MDNYTQLANKLLKESMDSATPHSDTSLADQMIALDDDGRFIAPPVKSYIEDAESSADPVMAILQKYPDEVEDLKNGGELAQNLYEELFEYYLDSGEIPYGVAKARTGDPYEWVSDQLDELGIFTGTQPEDNEAEITDDDLKTLQTAKELAGGQAKGGLFSNPEKQIQKAYGKMLSKVSKKINQVANKV